jgi:glycosyltransferase involved in cell wall biosynthesis
VKIDNDLRDVPAGSDVAMLFRAQSTKHRPLHIAMVSNIPPQQCGIATFLGDVRSSLQQIDPNIRIDSYALTDNDEIAAPPGTHNIKRHDYNAYVAASRAINATTAEIIWIQHEYGIFGGADGNYVCDFIDRIAAPVIVTLHTILPNPSLRQAQIIHHIASKAMRLMVMSNDAQQLLINLYGVAPDRIIIIPHGAPDRPFGRTEQFKRQQGLTGHPVLMSFGLLGPGKGLETAIAALPAIVAEHPQVIYRIVGATHPNLVRQEGETYRLALKALAERLEVADYIRWDDRFLSQEELLDQLEACDIYLTPYPNLQQSTSGTLSYAFAMGKAIISTRYRHAEELLADDCGVLIAPDDVTGLAQAVRGLLAKPERLYHLQERAYSAGRKTIWPRFAAASLAMIRQVVVRGTATVKPYAQPASDAVITMTDGVGMLQHSIGPVPDRRHGYCLDDNARALILMHDAEHIPNKIRERLALTYASFVQHAWHDQAQTFRNFMSYERQWLEERGSDDSYGRALWVLGATAARANNSDMRRWALNFFETSLPGFASIEAPRAIALASIGAAAIVSVYPHHAEAMALLHRCGMNFAHMLDRTRRPDWPWFETLLAYDNPRLPQALILAGQYCENDSWINVGVETLQWICQRQFAAAGHFRSVGSETFGKVFDQLPFDQQPLEAQAVVEACFDAWCLTKETCFRDYSEGAYAWFIGKNDRQEVLADFETGRCYDGLTPTGVNRNSGAESILAFHASFSAIERMRAAVQSNDERGINCAKAWQSKRLATT